VVVEAARVRAEAQRKRPDEEQKRDDQEFHDLMMPAWYDKRKSEKR